MKLSEASYAGEPGLGLSVAVPQARHRPQIRVLPLPEFSPVTFGVLWQGRPTPITQAFPAVFEQAAGTQMSQPAR